MFERLGLRPGQLGSVLGIGVRRLVSRPGLSVLSLLGIALAIAVVASIPVLLDSVGLELLRVELDRHAFGNLNPPVAMRVYRVPSATEYLSIDQALQIGDWIADASSRYVGLPLSRRHTQLGSVAFWLAPAGESAERYGQDGLAQSRLNCILDVADQIKIVEGQPLHSADASDELLVWALPELTERLGLQIGDTFTLHSPRLVDEAEPVICRFAGVWEPLDSAGPFWYRDPHDLIDSDLLTTVDAYRTHIEPHILSGLDFSFWYVVLDETRLRFDRVDDYEQGARQFEERVDRALDWAKLDRSPIEPLMVVQRRVAVLKVLVLGFSLPVVALLMVFVGAISSLTVSYQQRQVAIMTSRGAGRWQVLAIGLAEGLLLAIPATLMALALSWLLARMMSLNTGFMTFDRTESLAPAMHALDWRLILGALLTSVGVRIWPAVRQARDSIKDFEARRTRPKLGATILRLLLSALLLAATVYAYQRLAARGTMGLIDWEPGDFGGALQDPLIFLAPTLFIASVAWFAAQLFPWLMRLPDLLGSLLPWPALYLGLRDMTRGATRYTVPLFLLTASLCLGGLEASIAATATSWLTDRWRYEVGADYTFGLSSEQRTGMMAGEDAWLLPAAEFTQLPHATDATRVSHYRIIEEGTRWWHEPEIMAIDVDGFQRVAYFRDDYADEPLGELLNRLRANPQGLLVSKAFLSRNQLDVGDTVTLRINMIEAFSEIDFKIVGLYDYFPTIYDREGRTVIGNLDYIHQSFGGVGPFDVWLRTDGPIALPELLEAAEEMDIVTVRETDGRALLIQDAQRMERVGIFGSLSMGFLASAVAACAGILVYATASVTSRARRLTILRAIGLGMGQVMAMLLFEFLVVTLYGVLVGTTAGIACARLYGQFFQFTDDPTLQIPPFVPQVAYREIVLLATSVAAVLMGAQTVLMLRMVRRRVFQALRLGDE